MTIAQKTIRGALWVGFTQAGATLLEVGKMIVLARLLRPGDFGLLALCYLFMGALRLFSSVGMGQALIYEKDRIPEATQVAFWLNLGVNLFLLAIALAGAIPFATFYGQPEVAPMIWALGGTLVLQALGAIHQNLLEKSLAFRRKALVVLAPNVPGVLAAIGVAYWGGGAWSIIVGQAVMSCLTTALAWWLVPWRPAWQFDRGVADRMVGYGKNIFGSGIAYYLITNADYAILGRVVDRVRLGFYLFGYEKAFIPWKYVTARLSEVFFPALSLVREDPAQLRATYRQLLTLMAAVTTPLSVGLGLTAPELVRVLFGAQWDHAVPVLQWISLWVVVHSWQSLSCNLAQAWGRPDVPFKNYLGRLPVLIGAILLAAPRGIGVTAIAVTATQLLADGLLIGQIHRLLAVGFREVVRSLVAPLSSVLVMALGLWVWRSLTTGWPTSLIFGGDLLLGAALYFGSLLGLHRDVQALCRDWGKKQAGTF